MEKTSSFSYQKNVFLDRARMDELYAILMKYSCHLTIQAETIDGSSIKFESYDELMGYTNYKKGRIKKLEICGYWNTLIDRVFAVTFRSGHLAKSSVECEYNFTESDKEIVFCKEIQTFLDKANSSYIPALIGEIISFCLICLAVVFAAPLAHSAIGCIMIGIGLSIAYVVFLYFVWKKLFPLVSFSWGESVAYYKSIATLRSSLFWCVIVAFIMGIFVTFVSNGLFNTK